MGCTSSAVVSVPDQIQDHLRNNAPHLYSLIHEFDAFICLYCDEGTRLRAIQRYETLWLPLILSIADESERLSLVPPIDVHFVWYCHMLAPNDYMDDIERLAEQLQEQQQATGNAANTTANSSNRSNKSNNNTATFATRLDHKLMSKADRERGRDLARQLWIKRYGKQVPFDINLEEESHRTMESYAIQQGVALTNHTHLTGAIIGGNSNNNNNSISKDSPSHSPKANSWLSNSLGGDNSDKRSTVSTNLQPSSDVNPEMIDELGEITPYLTTVITNNENMNIHTIMQNQLLVHYQFQLPHYVQDEYFLQQAIDRYLTIYLDLFRLEPMKIWLPTFDMQYVWYIHLIASPILYIEHCRKLLDQILSLTHVNDQLYNMQERFESWQRMNEIISKRKLLSIHLDGGMYRGDPSTNRLSNLLLQRSIKEYEGFYPKEVKIVGSFGRGWQAKIDRIHLSVTPLSPPCPPTTMLRRFQNMDIEDKIEEDRLYEESDSDLPMGKRCLHRLNLTSRPRIKRLCLLTGGMRVSTILSTEGVCMEFHLKNELVATVHSLHPGQYRHGCFDSYCVNCIKTFSSGGGGIANADDQQGGLSGNSSNPATSSATNGSDENSGPNNSASTNDNNEKCECQVFLLRIAGIDHALIHGVWSKTTNNVACNSNNNSATAPADQSVPTNGSSGVGETSGVAAFGLDGLNLNLVSDTPTLPTFTTSPNIVTSYPMITIYNVPFQETRIVNVVPSGATTKSNKRQLHSYQFKSVCRLLGYDNVEDNITVDLQQGFIQGERNAPPVVSIALGMTIALMHITLRPEEYCPIQDDTVNPFLLALGGLLPGEEAAKVPFPSFASLLKSNTSSVQ